MSPLPQATATKKVFLDTTNPMESQESQEAPISCSSEMLDAAYISNSSLTSSQSQD
jgi:hypothetical protein